MEAATASRSQNAASVRRIIASKLETFLCETRLRHVHFADSSVAPPPLAHFTNFPRLSLPIEGFHAMELPVRGRSELIAPGCGDAVFVPAHAWNRPDWADSVKVITFLFGVKQIGISLVTHRGGNECSAQAIKTSVQGAHDLPSRNILNALAALTAESPTGPLPKLVTESLLYACLRLLCAPDNSTHRKAVHTYEVLCLYVQENFQHQLTREAVARRFGIAPTHVSRLFRNEGLMNFRDYVNLVRMNRAKFILASYDVPLKEVAASCGYSDVAYFCKVFKGVTKTTPTQYRDRGTVIAGSSARVSGGPDSV
jgi:AraC-like DNA-binding protein